MKNLPSFHLIGVAVAVALAWLGACNGSSTAPVPTPEPGPVCPATTADTVGAACAFPGLICSPTYVCGFTDVTLLCTCKNGAFVCTDSAGDALSGPPMCPGPVPPESCPATVRRARVRAEAARDDTTRRSQGVPRDAGILFETKEENVQELRFYDARATFACGRGERARATR